MGLFKNIKQAFESMPAQDPEEMEAALASLTPEQRAAYDAQMAMVAGAQAESQASFEEARAIGDHLFEEFADIPLFWFANEVIANPKVVSEWVYPGLGAGRSTHFHLIKAAAK